MGRVAEISRSTGETEIGLSLCLDGGEIEIRTGVGFFDHMLNLFAAHGRFGLKLNCDGDIDVDFHHTVEDVGIALGAAFSKALGEKRGIVRYGSFLLPMDEALVMVALDISGRAGLYYDAQLPSDKVGDFDTELVEEFFNSVCRNMGLTLHIRQISGRNTHHIIEAMFKGFGRALKDAVKLDESLKGAIPSTKGVL
ncbi:MAG: imidazoleglycerol-phosphate dehydratase HisB [Christensenellales bacterium]